MQFIIVPCSPPDDAEPGQEYATIVKHIYLHKTKIAVTLCMNACAGVCYKIEYGRYFRAGLSALNYMFDRMGGMQVRHWVLQAKAGKKPTQDNMARNEGYRF